MRAAIWMAAAALAVSGCDFTPRGILGDYGGSSYDDLPYASATANSGQVSCPGIPEGWYSVEKTEHLPSFCDPMLDAFPKIEVEGTDGSLKLTVRKLSRGGFPTIKSLSYSKRDEGLLEFDFECGTPKDLEDRREIVCKHKWKHAVSPSHTSPEQVQVDLLGVTLENPACGNTALFAWFARDKAPCELYGQGQPSPCPLSGSPIGACPDGVPAPTLWLSLN